MLRLGDRVLAMWPVEVEWWYPGVVCLVAGNDVEVQFDDGDRSLVTTDDVIPLAIGVGTRVHGRWRGDKFYFPGRVSEQRGPAIHIEYDDGDEEWTTVSMVRVHREDLPEKS
jgi:hypothetical protein